MIFKEVFQGARVFLAVVHVESEEQALRNTAVARNNGAHGVFLINHGMSHWALIEIYKKAREANPAWWIGLNLLGLSAAQAFSILPGDASGLWSDSSGIKLDGPQALDEAYRIAQAHESCLNRGWNGLYFGGAAFKHQPKTGDIAQEARIATQFTDIVTTSGERTGEPPSAEKIRVMREAVGEHPLAIASGITPENVVEFLPLANCFLVATGVSHSHSELDPDRVRTLADIVRAYR